MGRNELIEHYTRGGEQLTLAIRGLTREDMLAVPSNPAPETGKWSIQQLVCHLSDSELVYADRIKRIIAEDNPTLQGFDENLWVKNLHYEDQNAEDAAKLIELTRKQLGHVLGKLPESGFARAGNHTEAGRQTLLQILEKANNHLAHHLKFIHAKRAAMGKEMW